MHRRRDRRRSGGAGAAGLPGRLQPRGAAVRPAGGGAAARAHSEPKSALQCPPGPGARAAAARRGRPRAAARGAAHRHRQAGSHPFRRRARRGGRPQPGIRPRPLRPSHGGPPPAAARGAAAGDGARRDRPGVGAAAPLRDGAPPARRRSQRVGGGAGAAGMPARAGGGAGATLAGPGGHRGGRRAPHLPGTRSPRRRRGPASARPRGRSRDSGGDLPRTHAGPGGGHPRRPQGGRRLPAARSGLSGGAAPLHVGGCGRRDGADERHPRSPPAGRQAVHPARRRSRARPARLRSARNCGPGGGGRRQPGVPDLYLGIHRPAQRGRHPPWQRGGDGRVGARGLHGRGVRGGARLHLRLFRPLGLRAVRAPQPGRPGGAGARCPGAAGARRIDHPGQHRPLGARGAAGAGAPAAVRTVRQPGRGSPLRGARGAPRRRAAGGPHPQSLRTVRGHDLLHLGRDPPRRRRPAVHRPPAAGHHGPRAGSRPEAGAAGRARRALPGRNRTRPRISRPARSDRRAVRPRSLRRARDAPLPHRRPRPPPDGRRPGLPRPHRPAGEGARLPRRAGGDRGGAARPRRGSPGGGGGPAGRGGRGGSPDRLLRARRRGASHRRRAARLLARPPAGLVPPRELRAPGGAATDAERQAGPPRPAGAARPGDGGRGGGSPGTRRGGADRRLGRGARPGARRRRRFLLPRRPLPARGAGGLAAARRLEGRAAGARPLRGSLAVRPGAAGGGAAAQRTARGPPAGALRRDRPGAPLLGAAAALAPPSLRAGEPRLPHRRSGPPHRRATARSSRRRGGVPGRAPGGPAHGFPTRRGRAAPAGGRGHDSALVMDRPASAAPVPPRGRGPADRVGRGPAPLRSLGGAARPHGAAAAGRR